MKKILVSTILLTIAGMAYLTWEQFRLRDTQGPDSSPELAANPEEIAPPEIEPTATRVSATATATLEPLQLSFPDNENPPESNWRPPLYPVPWSPTAHDHFYLIRPTLAGETNWALDSYRYGGIFFDDIVHTGIDIKSEEGVPVVAAGAGKVIWAGYGLYSGVDEPGDPYGLAVAIRHDFGHQGETIYTLYGHLSEVQVTQGQLVQAGEQIGLVGQTGFTTGPHLHFEVRVGANDFNDNFNPELWMAPPQGWGVIAARIMGTANQLLFNQAIYITNLNTHQEWNVVSYGDSPGINQDPYYQENVALGDLPAGDYLIEIPYFGERFSVRTTVYPGHVTYFQFRGRQGFDMSPPPALESDFVAPDATATPFGTPGQ
jgi:murein DD-endopeptidase MepM/ murein hydrolase activator NlpD